MRKKLLGESQTTGDLTRNTGQQHIYGLHNMAIIETEYTKCVPQLGACSGRHTRMQCLRIDRIQQCWQCGERGENADQCKLTTSGHYVMVSIRA